MEALLLRNENPECVLKSQEKSKLSDTIPFSGLQRNEPLSLAKQRNTLYPPQKPGSHRLVG